MSASRILALRTNLAFSRRVVEAFTRENAEYLLARGVKVTFPGLRLAHLLGPAGAVQALKASPDTPLSRIFSSGVLRANPFMTRLNVAGLIRRAEREVGITDSSQAASVPALPVERVALRREASETATRMTDTSAAAVAAKPQVAKAEPARRNTSVQRVASTGRAGKHRAHRVSSKYRTAVLKCKAGTKNCQKLASAGKRKLRVAGS